MAGHSIPAAEHRYNYYNTIIYHNYIMYCYSTITTWTKEGELDAFRNMLEKVSFK